MDWLEVARQLPLGHKRRFQHECGTDRSGLAAHNADGYSGYCFRCGKLGFQGHGYRTLEELQRVRELNTAAETQQHTLELPDDFTTTIPAAHTTWLSRGGISASHARTLNIGWSPKLGRVILPVYDSSGSICYWQGRAVLRGQTPKYINPQADKTALLCWPEPPTDDSRDRSVCITEDFLSAARLAKHMQGCTALGTKLSEQQAVQIADRAGNGSILVWLDPDRAGVDGSRAMFRKLSLLSDNVRIISSLADPKNLNDREMRDTLGLIPNHRYTYHASTTAK